MTKMASHKRYTKPLGAHCLIMSASLAASRPFAFLGLRLAKAAYVFSTWRMAALSRPRSRYSRRRTSALIARSTSSRSLGSEALADQNWIWAGGGDRGSGVEGGACGGVL